METAKALRVLLSVCILCGIHGDGTAEKSTKAFVFIYPNWIEITCNKPSMIIDFKEGRPPICKCKKPGYHVNIKNILDTSFARCEDSNRNQYEDGDSNIEVSTASTSPRTSSTTESPTSQAGPADLMRFTANSHTKCLEVMEGDNVTFLCGGATGISDPSVCIKSLNKNKTLKLHRLSINSKQLTNATFSANCNSTGWYSCTVDNNHVGKILLIVHCAPELMSPGQLGKEFKTNEGKDLNITAIILSYPAPTVFKVSKVDINTDRHQQSSVALDNGAYSVKYVPGGLREGTVVLTMPGLRKESDGQYVFTIINGIGGGLNYTFNVVVVTGVDAEGSSSGLSKVANVLIVIGVISLIAGCIAFAIKGFQMSSVFCCQERGEDPLLMDDPEDSPQEFGPFQDESGEPRPLLEENSLRQGDMGTENPVVTYTPRARDPNSLIRIK